LLGGDEPLDLGSLEQFAEFRVEPVTQRRDLAARTVGAARPTHAFTVRTGHVRSVGVERIEISKIERAPQVVPNFRGASTKRRQRFEHGMRLLCRKNRTDGRAVGRIGGIEFGDNRLECTRARGYAAG